MKKFILKYVLVVSVFFNPITTNAEPIEITITGIRNQSGQISIHVFNNQEGFKAEKSIQSFTFKKQNMINGTMKVKIDLAHGTYGLSLVDDENSNNDMDYNFVGMPKEGFGFSNYYHTGFTRPVFDQFKFNLLKGNSAKVTMKTRYI